MKQFAKAVWPPLSPERWKEIVQMYVEAYPGATQDQILKRYEMDMDGDLFRNNKYQVLKKDAGEYWWLSIKRIDKQPIHDWRDLQKIKNMLVGDENEAVELYPAESRLMDTANQYHLWVTKDKTFRYPFGFTERCVVETPGFSGAKQRKF